LYRFKIDIGGQREGRIYRIAPFAHNRRGNGRKNFGVGEKKKEENEQL